MNFQPLRIPNQDKMKHEAEYKTIIGLPEGSSMDGAGADAIRVISGKTSNLPEHLRVNGTPRVIFFDGGVYDGDQVSSR